MPNILRLFSSPFFRFEFIRLLGHATAQGAEIGECLEAIASMKSETAEEWFRVWHDMALQVTDLADKAHKSGDVEGARLALLRSANYFRASEFFLHTTPEDPRLFRAVENSVTNFQKACRLGRHDTQVLEIPYLDGTTLPAYLYQPALPRRPEMGDVKPPLILLPSGFDNTQEELYFYLVSAALDRGYAVVTFEGPGQGIVLRRDSLHLRPDWETVTSHVLDFLFTRSDGLNLEKIAIVGASMGAYFAMRSCADPRIKACVTCDGFYDLYDVTISRIPSWFVSLWNAGTIPDYVFNGTVALLQKLNFQTAWEMRHAMWVFGVNSPAAVVREMRRYSLKNDLKHVRCPVLVTGAADSLYFPPKDNAVKIFAGLSHLADDQKELWIAKGLANGGCQGKVGATATLHLRVFEWLNSQLQQ